MNQKNVQDRVCEAFVQSRLTALDQRFKSANQNIHWNEYTQVVSQLTRWGLSTFAVWLCSQEQQEAAQ